MTKSMILYFTEKVPSYKNYPCKMELELTERFDEKKQSLDVLKERGLKGTIQGPRKVNDLFDE